MAGIHERNFPLRNFGILNRPRDSLPKPEAFMIHVTHFAEQITYFLSLYVEASRPLYCFQRPS